MSKLNKLDEEVHQLTTPPIWLTNKTNIINMSSKTVKLSALFKDNKESTKIEIRPGAIFPLPESNFVILWD